MSSVSPRMCISDSYHPSIKIDLTAKAALRVFLVSTWNTLRFASRGGRDGGGR